MLHSYSRHTQTKHGLLAVYEVGHNELDGLHFMWLFFVDLFLFHSWSATSVIKEALLVPPYQFDQLHEMVVLHWMLAICPRLQLDGLISVFTALKELMITLWTILWTDNYMALLCEFQKTGLGFAYYTIWQPVKRVKVKGDLEKCMILNINRKFQHMTHCKKKLW